MPVTCLVVNCGSRADREYTLSFFRVPAIIKSVHYPHLNELSKKRREMWIATIKREGLTESIVKYQRVCSKHFITGKPSALTDVNHPDWIPTQNMGHTSQAYLKRKTALDRKLRADKRRKLRFAEVVSPTEVESDKQTTCEVVEQQEKVVEVETGCATQTVITMDMLSKQLEQLQFASKKIAVLKRKVENSPLGLMDSIANAAKWMYYTGFDYEFIKTILFPEIEPYITSTYTTVLSSFYQVLLTLVKLRLNLHFKHLAFCFKVSASTASKYFQNIIHIMYDRFEPLIIWPEVPESKMNVRLCFKEVFQDKATVIIYCFEVFIEKPENYLTQQQCWSNYKHHHTIKFLIGITPQGTISYISKGWGGRASDKQMVEKGDFLELIKPGDVVLADRGFLIGDTLGIIGAKLVIPAFTRGKSQLHPLEIEETRHIAHVRIHVERIIGSVNNKFRIFKGPLPISMLKEGSHVLCILDKNVTVCSALINILPPIVPS